ncbi:MAG TPA: hypothetical protein VFE46_10555 [Pirellulales bacterium]|nr:hypothetical protein [Pirellulales bacterium]
METDKLLIVGLETLAGSNLALTLAKRCEVVGLSRQRGFAVENCRTLTPDGFAWGGRTDADRAVRAIAVEQPRWVVYCGPASVSNWDLPRSLAAEQTHASAFDEAQITSEVAAAWQAAGQCGAKFVLVSTDAICTGPQIFCCEKMPVSAILGETMDNRPAIMAWKLERQLDRSAALVLRTHLFGWSAMGESYAEQLWLTLEDGTLASTVGGQATICAPQVSGRHYATPILASDFAELLWTALQRGLSGMFHAAGAERTSQWQFATELATVSGMWLTGTPWQSGFNKENGSETSLDSRHLQWTLNFPLPRLRDGLERFTLQAANGYRDSLRAAFFMPMPEPVAA